MMKLPQKNYVLSLINYLPNLYLDRKGSLEMTGNLQMNDNRITGLTNPPPSVSEAVNKKYVDDSVKKVILNHHILQKMYFNIS